MKERRYYYFDERNDDFAATDIHTKPTPADYDYQPKNIFYRFFKPIVYYLVLLLVVVEVRLLLFVPVKNRRVLRRRRDRKKGYFLYSNHTSYLTDAISPPAAAFPRPCSVVVGPDALSIPGMKLLLRFVGAIPTPQALASFRPFEAEIRRIYERGGAISIFPEAHIWPKYSAIRDFPAVSFAYPVRLNAPCFARTTIYRKTRSGRTRRMVVYDGPFYPDPGLPAAQAKADLCRRVKERMRERCEQYQSSPDARYAYIRVDSPEQVRQEIKNRQIR